MPNPPTIVITNRREFNDLMGLLRDRIVSAYNEAQAVLALISKGEPDVELLEKCLKRIKAAGRDMVETLILIRKMQDAAAKMLSVWNEFFGRGGPAAQIFQAAGFDSANADRWLNQILAHLPRFLEGCKRELALLKSIAEKIEAMIKIAKD